MENQALLVWWNILSLEYSRLDEFNGLRRFNFEEDDVFGDRLDTYWDEGGVGHMSNFVPIDLNGATTPNSRSSPPFRSASRRLGITVFPPFPARKLHS